MLAEKLVFTYSSKLAIQFIQIIASIVVARIAGAEVLGTVAFGLAYVSMFSSVADLGLGTAHMKILSAGGKIEECLGTFIRLKLCLVLAYIVVVLAFFTLQRFVFEVDFESRNHIIVIFILLGSLSLNEIFAIPKTTFASFTEIVKSNLPTIIQTFLYQMLRIILVILGFKAIGLAVGNIISVVLVIPIYYYMFKEYEIGTFNRELARKYIKNALPLIVIGISTKITATIDKVLLQSFTNSLNVGYYAAGFRIGGFVLLIGQSVNNLLFPTFSKAFSNDRLDLIRDNLYKFERFTFIFIMPFVILITLNSDIIITTLLGNEYNSSIPIMKVVNISMFIMVINVPFSSVISGKGKFRQLAMVNGINLILYIAILIILIHPKLLDLAGFGTAIALLCSYIMIGIYYRYAASKYVTFLKTTFAIKYLIYGVLNYSAFGYFMGFELIGNTLMWRIVFAIIYLIVTYISLFVLHMINKKDWQYLKKLFALRRVSSYVKNELRGNDSQCN